jgi:hypothetical protein
MYIFLPAPHMNGRLGEGVFMFLHPFYSGRVLPPWPGRAWNAAYEADKDAAMK